MKYIWYSPQKSKYPLFILTWRFILNLIDIECILQICVLYQALLCPFTACKEPTTPENGTVVISTVGLRDLATYSCDINFTLNGSSVRQCGSNGEYWDGSDPVCGMI